MLVDALEHPVVVMERRIGGVMEDQIGLESVVLVVVAAFDRCALLSIWKAEVHVEPSDVIESISRFNPNYPMRCHIRSHKNIISGYKQLILRC